MEKPHDFPKAAKIAFSSLVVMYSPVAFISYFILGEDVLLDSDNNSNVVNALPKSTVTYVLYSCVWITVLTTYVVLMLPVFRTFEMILKLDETVPCHHSSTYEGKSVGRGMRKGFLRGGLLAATYLVSVIVPFFGDIVSLIGGTSITASSFLLPIWFYLKIFGKDLISPERSKKERTKGYFEIGACVLIFILSLVAGISGSAFAVENIISNLGTYSFFD